jgi:hypothetical protein
VSGLSWWCAAAPKACRSASAPGGTNRRARRDWSLAYRGGWCWQTKATNVERGVEACSRLCEWFARGWCGLRGWKGVNRGRGWMSTVGTVYARRLIRCYCLVTTDTVSFAFFFGLSCTKTKREMSSFKYKALRIKEEFIRRT